MTCILQKNTSAILINHTKRQEKLNGLSLFMVLVNVLVGIISCP